MISKHFVFVLFVSLSSFCVSQSRLWKIQVEGASLFSSPRSVDLNRDGILDIVIGGGVENSPSKNGVIAINGANGENLWAIETATQIYTSALFQDITGDTVPEVFIGGRAANYFAINGSTGEVIWQFFEGDQNESRSAGFLNFFGTQFVEDLDQDGLKDLLLTNGGDYLAKTGENDRPTARIMIISSATGKILQSARVPNGKESYYAPHIIPLKGKEYIVFGTGGETIGGSLFYAPYEEFKKKGSLEKAKVLVADSAKGFILNSVCADLNGDSELDVISAGMNGSLFAFDAITHKRIWTVSFPGRECYVTPSLGFFNDDKVPDVFTIVATGSFPQYSKFELIVLDGKTGEILVQENRGVNQFAPAAVFNFDEDPTNEVLYLENKIVDPKTYQMENKLCIYDVEQNKTTFLGPQRKGLSMASAPLILDINNDGVLEVVLCCSTLPTAEGELPSGVIECLTLPTSTEEVIWPGYLGPNENGVLE